MSTPLYRLNKKIKDEKFSTEEIGKYNLNLQVNNTLFRICITDSETNRCLLLEDYIIDSVLYPEQLIEQLALLYDDHAVLKAGFWKSIRIAIKEIDFSLIPKGLFEKEHLKDYLKVNSGLPNAAPENGLYYYNQKSTDAVNIFCTDKKIIDWFTRQYPGKAITIIHHTSPLIEGIMFDGKDESEKSVYVQVENGFLTGLVKSTRGLEFCNSFYYSTTEDFVYFVMFVYHQLNLNPDKTPLVLFGEIAPDSEVFRKLYKYIRFVNFGEKPSSLSFSYHFDEIFDHRFFDLYSMHFCD